MSLTYIGLILISIAWFVQFFFMTKKNIDVQFLFIIFYLIGTACLIFDSLTIGSASIAYLNGIPLLGALLVMNKLKK